MWRSSKLDNQQLLFWQASSQLLRQWRSQRRWSGVVTHSNTFVQFVGWLHCWMIKLCHLIFWVLQLVVHHVDTASWVTMLKSHLLTSTKKLWRLFSCKLMLKHVRKTSVHKCAKSLLTTTGKWLLTMICLKKLTTSLNTQRPLLVVSTKVTWKFLTKCWLRQWRSTNVSSTWLMLTVLCYHTSSQFVTETLNTSTTWLPVTRRCWLLVWKTLSSSTTRIKSTISTSTTTSWKLFHSTLSWDQLLHTRAVPRLWLPLSPVVWTSQLTNKQSWLALVRFTSSTWWLVWSVSSTNCKVSWVRSTPTCLVKMLPWPKQSANTTCQSQLMVNCQHQIWVRFWLWLTSWIACCHSSPVVWYHQVQTTHTLCVVPLQVL